MICNDLNVNYAFAFQVLDTTQSHKIVHKVEEALRRISCGLQKNKDLKNEDLIILVHTILSQPETLLMQKISDENLEKDETSLAVETKKTSDEEKLKLTTNDHVITEFALNLLWISLKKQRIDSSYIEMLDPFVKILMNNMSSSYFKIISLSLKILSFLINFHVPSILNAKTELARHFFKILKKYTKYNTASNKMENFDLVSTSFKSMSVLIKDYEYTTLSSKQLEILLVFIEEDVHSQNELNSISLMKAILSKKFKSKNLDELIWKMCELTIKGKEEKTRQQCKQLVLQYLLNYPVGKTLMKFINFYLSNLR